MTNPDDIEARFRELEREMNARTDNPLKRAEPELADDTPVTPSLSISGLIAWINGLTGTTKIVAIVVVGIVAFTVINILFKLVAAAISLGILAIVVYVLYKLFFEQEKKS